MLRLPILHTAENRQEYRLAAKLVVSVSTKRRVSRGSVRELQYAQRWRGSRSNQLPEEQDLYQYTKDRSN